MMYGSCNIAGKQIARLRKALRRRADKHLHTNPVPARDGALHQIRIPGRIIWYTFDVYCVNKHMHTDSHA